MSAYEFFKDFAGPLSTATAALAAAFVTGLFAYRQARTAELQAGIALDKLKYETFETRHDVLDACRDLYAFCENSVRSECIIDAATVESYVVRIDAAKFYFGRQVCRSLGSFVRAARALQKVQTDLAIVERPRAFRDEAELVRHQAQFTFRHTARLVEELLEYDLSLNLLKRGSDQKHGLPEQFRRQRARQAFYDRIRSRARRLARLGRVRTGLRASAPPEGVAQDRGSAD